MKEFQQIVKYWYEPYIGFILPLFIFSISYPNLLKLLKESDRNILSLNAWGISVVVSVFLSLAALFFWFCTRNYPRRNKDKIGILIAIRDNSENARKVKEDVIDNFKNILSETEEKVQIEVLFLKDHLAKKVKDIKTAVVSSNKTKCQFVVYGKSQNYDNEYNFDLQFVVRHKPLEVKQKNKIEQGFVDVLINKNWSFVSENIFDAIPVTAQNIREIALYVMGIAAQLGGGFAVSDNLHTTLLEILKKEPAKRKILSPVYKQLPYWISDSRSVLALKKYTNKDLRGAYEINETALSIDSNNYSALVNKSVYLFQLGDIDESKKVIKRLRRRNARQNLPDSTWRYNEAFLVLIGGNLDRAFKLYKKAVNGYVTDFTFASSVNFLVDYYERNQDKHEVLFIKGYILEKKSYESLAIDDYESFIKKTENINKYHIYRNKAIAYLRGIYKLIQIKEKDQMIL